jgi:DNA-binding transcriptional LysR family regulator
MELKHLKSFQAVADHLNFRRAAAEVHVTQPALSRQIAQLEGDVGRALFVRDRRRVALTPAGAYLYRRVGALLESLDELARETREAGEGKRGILSVGYTEASMSSFLPGLLRRVRTTRPDLSLHLRQDHSEQLAREVARGRLDVAFASLPVRDPALSSTLVAHEDIGVVLPEGHVLARVREVRLSALADEGFILFPYAANPKLHADLMAACRDAGFTPRVVEEADTRILAVNLVAAGLGISFLGVHLAHLCGSGTVFRPLKRPRPSMQFHLIEPARQAHPVLGEMKAMLQVRDRPVRPGG